MPSTPPPTNSTITVGGVSAFIFIDGWRKGVNRFNGGPWREVIYQVPFSQSDDFINALMGQIKLAGGAGGTITRVAPHQYPLNPILYCIDARGEPMGVPKPDAKLLAVEDGMGGDGLCHVLARYEPLPFDVAGTDTNNSVGGFGVPWTSWKVHGGTDIEHIPTGAMILEGSSLPPSQPYPLRVLVEEVTVTFHQVPSIYLNVYRALKNSLNNAIFFGWNPGCVMYDDYSFDASYNTDGSRTQELTLTFIAKPHDHNKILRDDDYAYDFIKGRANNTRPYPYNDLTVLLR